MPILEENNFLLNQRQERLFSAPAWTNVFLNPVSIIIITHIVAMSITAVFCLALNSPFILWFNDIPFVLFAALIYTMILGIIWDGLLIAIGITFQAIKRWIPSASEIKITVESFRNIRFYTCAFFPLVMISLTAIALLFTSNITLLNLKLLGTVTHWHDSIFWQIEGSVFRQLVLLPINTDMWDSLYHSAWAIELFAAFVLVVIGRGPRIILHYCVSMILLFYLGRFLGILTPVMGPAFYQPELFGYLDGSLTQKAMQLVTEVLHFTPEQARHSSGILLGGVSAMPSLHIGMVTLTSYWLAVVKRKTLFITVPWVMMVWTSTVVLGWHYILDGAGGVILGFACAFATTWILRKIQMPSDHT